MVQFEGLDRIDWAGLRHAYGEASDTPSLLRALIAPAEELRIEALDKLENSLVHQGSVYPASLAAIPFLIELVADQSYPQRVSILRLLTDIAQGHSWCDAHQSFMQLVGMNDAAFNEQLEQELLVVAQIKQAFQAQLAFFMELFHDPDKQIWRQALNIVAEIKPTDADQASIIDSVLNHANVDYRADCLILLSRWESEHILTTAQRLLDTATDDLLKLVATIRYIFHSVPAPIPDQLFAYIGHVIEHHDPALIEHYEALALTNGFWFDLACCLACGDPASREAYIPYFIEALLSHKHNDSYWNAALLAAFGSFDVDPEHIPTPLQRQIVAIIADVAYEKVGVVYTNPLSLLEQFGLPHTSRELDGYLGYPNVDHASLEERSKPKQ
ncbi:hypothetical protein [Herpetosiphon sp. NSE202]|uniref:hypothetical protein n=1 Tax=Herpetosiphon sp. NSE202 TaxID=3351349 RepID=UPI0036300698